MIQWKMMTLTLMFKIIYYVNNVISSHDTKKANDEHKRC